MSPRLLSIAMILALASAAVPLRGGQFTTETDLLYTVQEISEKEMFYYEAELGCNIQCSNHCIETQGGNALARCFGYCGCNSLLSAQPLSAYRLDVVYPDGTAQTFNVNEPGNDYALVFNTPDDNSLTVSKVDYNNPNNDFTLGVGAQQQGKTTSEGLYFQGANPNDYAYATHSATQLPNGWDGSTQFGTADFNYDVQSQGRVKESRNKVEFTYNETGVGSDGHGFNTQVQATGKDKRGEGSSLSAGLEFNNWLEANALNAYKVDVFLPDGTKQSFTVQDPNDKSDKSLTVSTPTDESFSVDFKDSKRAENNFQLSGSSKQAPNDGQNSVLNFNSKNDQAKVYADTNRTGSTITERSGVQYNNSNGTKYSYQDNKSVFDYGRNPDGSHKYVFNDAASDSEGHGKNVNLDVDVSNERGVAEVSGEFEVNAWIDTTGLDQISEKQGTSFSTILWYAILFSGIVYAGYFGAMKLIENKSHNNEFRTRLVVYNDIQFSQVVLI